VIVAGIEPVDKNPARLSFLDGRSNLVLRVVSSLILAPLALAAAYWGGLVFLAFWTVAALIVLWEWDTLVCAHDRNSVLTIGAAAMVGASLLMALDRIGIALALVCLGAFGVAALASRIRRPWCAAGMLYASALLIAPVILRTDHVRGFHAIIFLFVIVWATDISAYFVGRAVGGPKLMPSVSPNKTWSGAIGGTLVGVVGGVITANQFGVPGWVAITLVALVLSIASQLGDLAESAIKREFSAKDASQLIPGHGGLMDRLDGFVAAVVAATLIGLAHGSLGASARGLMLW
jgi:phosphatidate cytidylyltransferase